MALGSGTTLAIVVTGASSGIGRAIAKVVAREKCTLVLVGRSASGLDKTSAEVCQAGGQAITFELDLVSGDAAARLDDFLSSHGLVCDILVNSAGFGRRGAATALTVDEQLGIVDLNVRALTELTLHFLPDMVRRKRGGIINFSSVAGFAPGPYMALYYASKGFVRSLSEALHEEVRRSGVTVTCVAPGPVETDFYERAGANKTAIFTYFPKMNPDRVAETAWNGFKAGRRLVVPGTSAKLLKSILGLLPSRVKLPLIGRLQRMGNDPCYCGSGKKFKKCCGAK